MSGKWGLSFALAALCAALVAGCGDDDDEASADEAEVRDAIERIAGSREPEDCTAYATQAYLEQTTFRTGADAVTECEAQAGTTATVEVDEVTIDGESATATVRTIDGELEGSIVEVGLVNEAGTWKLDSLDDFVVFDRGSYRDGLEQRMVEDGTPAQAVECVLGNFDRLGDAALEGLFLSGDPSQLEQLTVGCV